MPLTKRHSGRFSLFALGRARGMGKKSYSIFTIYSRSSDDYILNIGENLDMKRKAGILVLVIGLAATLPSNADVTNATGSESALSPLETPVTRALVDVIIAEVKNEDFERSVDQLLLGSDLQFGPIVGQSSGAPQTDLEQLLSNPRAIKILEHIHGLSERDKALACEALFARAFQIHTNLFSVWVLKQADPKIKTKSSVMSSRLTLLLAMFATAERGDRALLAKQFGQLDRFMDEANRIIAAQPPASKADLSAYFPLFFPEENRSQLNLLQLAADRETNRSLKLFDQVERELKQAETEKSEVQIFPWETDYETRWGRGNPDAKKRVTIYKFYDWTGVTGVDSEKPAQAALVKKLRGIVLP
jgi:hypothetical protein